MKIKLFFFLAALAVVPLTVAISEPGDTGNNILPYEIHQKKLDNGLNVVTVPYDSPGLASFYIVVRVGSRDEVEAGKTGFAHFFEHMMFRGTEKYPQQRYQETLKSTGASANANTSLDRTVYHMTGNADKLETMFEIESDRFRRLKYSIQGFKTEAGAVKGEYTKNFASPYMQLYEATNNTAFNAHTYQHTTMGFFDDVVDMPNQYDYSIEFFNRFYRPEYCTIIVVGDVKHQDVVDLSVKYFGGWKPGNFKSKITPESEQTETRYAHVVKENFPPYIDVNFKSPAFSNDNNDFHALSVLASILFSEKSPLYKKLVLDEQKARSLGGGIYPTRDPYLWSVSASLVKADDLKYVKTEILRVIEEAKNNPVSDDDLKQTLKRMKYSFALRMDSPDAIANALSRYTWLTGDPQSLNEAYRIYDKITPADLQRVAKKYLNTDKMTIATISPDKDLDIK
jgi:zinc protease